MDLGIIAEDSTDCDALAVLAKRIRPDVSKTRKRSANGCSRLERKAHAWMRELLAAGCTSILLVRDLDRNPLNYDLNDEAITRRTLSRISVPSGVSRYICIPVEELEAWFWSDPVTVRMVGRGVGDDHPNPHLIQKPKERLMALSRGAGVRPRYSTNDNAELADKLDIQLCAERCASFRGMRNWLIRL